MPLETSVSVSKPDCRTSQSHLYIYGNIIDPIGFVRSKVRALSITKVMPRLYSGPFKDIQRQQ